MFMQKPRRRAIFISDFLNPHCFYFKFTDQKFNEQLKVFEDNLADYALTRMKNNFVRFEPKINDIIACYNSSWSKWVRAAVKKVYPDGVAGKRYVLWAIDHGQYIKSYDKESLVPLPMKLRNCRFASVYQGSIYGYKPAILALNETLDEEMVPTNNWSPRAIDMCTQLIDKFSIVYFDVKSTRSGYLFGDLEFEMPDKHLISLEKCLWDLREIIKGEFYEEMIVKKYIQQHTNLFRNGNANKTDIVTQVNTSSRAAAGTDQAFEKKYNQLSNLQNKRENRLGNDFGARKVQMDDQSMSVLQSEIDGGITRMNKRL